MTGLNEASLRGRLPAFLVSAFEARAVDVVSARKLSGGAIQENWLLALQVAGGPRDGSNELVLRTDASSGVATSRSRADEFRILETVWRAGVRVPQPILLEPSDDVLDRPFFIVSVLKGTALGSRVVRDPAIGGDRTALATELAHELARIHAVQPDTAMADVLGPRPNDVVDALVQGYRADLDAVSRPTPIVELALRVLERERPNESSVTFCHRDYRTGNYMVDGAGLTGILDWEFAGWSDPIEDLGWFCSKTWRFGADDRPAGGLTSRTAFFNAYAEASGRPIDRRAALWWELMANVRWAVIAHQQTDRVLAGERSLELALIGRRIHETEREILTLIQALGAIAA